MHLRRKLLQPGIPLSHQSVPAAIRLSLLDGDPIPGFVKWGFGTLGMHAHLTRHLGLPLSECFKRSVDFLCNQFVVPL